MNSISFSNMSLKTREQIDCARKQLFAAAETARLPQELSDFKKNFQLIQNAYANLLSNDTITEADRVLIEGESIGHLDRKMELLLVCNEACLAPPMKMERRPLSLLSEAIIAVNERLRENGLSIRDLPANECPSDVLAHAPKWMQKWLQYESDMRAAMNSPFVREEERVPNWIETLQAGLQIHYGLPAARVLYWAELTRLSLPLRDAFERGQHELLEILLKAGANPNDAIRLDRPWTPLLTLARNSGDTRSIELLLQYGASEAHHRHPRDHPYCRVT